MRRGLNIRGISRQSERLIYAGKFPIGALTKSSIFLNLSCIYNYLSFRTPNMRLKTLLITLNWFVNETVYLGLSYYGPSLGNNQYFSFFLSSLVEIPSYIVCWFIMDRWGRRWPMCLLMIFG